MGTGRAILFGPQILVFRISPQIHYSAVLFAVNHLLVTLLLSIYSPHAPLFVISR